MKILNTSIEFTRAETHIIAYKTDKTSKKHTINPEQHTKEVKSNQSSDQLHKYDTIGINVTTSNIHFETRTKNAYKRSKIISINRTNYKNKAKMLRHELMLRLTTSNKYFERKIKHGLQN